MTISRLSAYLSQLEQTSSRNAMTQILGELLREAEIGETATICYLTLGRLGSLSQSLEFQLAEKMVIRILARAYGVGEGNVRGWYKSVGDLGEVAQQLTVKSRKFKVKDLSIIDVYQRLTKIAQESGEGSQERKVGGLVELLHDLDSPSTKYVIRMVLGRLRLGFSDATILDALSLMKTGDKSLRQEIDQAYFVRADIGTIAKRFKERGMAGLRGITVRLGVPVMPALCQRLKSADLMINKMGEVAVEPKYDGQRVQIHWRRDIPRLPGSSHRSRRTRDDSAGIESLPASSSDTARTNRQWTVRAFTRNLEEVSYMFPELRSIGAQISAREVILDSEAVGFDAVSGRILPFQEIITRKRKHAIEEVAKQVPLKFVVFDILLVDGRSLLDIPLAKRIEYLSERVSTDGVLMLSERIVTNSASDLRDFHRRQIEAGLEGVVVKKWNDPYIPGRRGFSWVKFKEAEEQAAGLADTLDCLVMGYYRGRGKRAGFGIGGFLVGVRRGEEFVTISKIGTGLADVQWREMRKRADALAVDEHPKEYGSIAKTLIPDVWVSPGIVVEIAADNITRSPVHGAGLALRFPRLIRFRDDKDPSQATTLKELKRLAAMSR